MATSNDSATRRGRGANATAQRLQERTVPEGLRKRLGRLRGTRHDRDGQSADHRAGTRILGPHSPLGHARSHPHASGRGVTPEEFDSYFDRFLVSAFRLEALPLYDVAAEQDEFDAWKRGEPLPERSIRTDPWLARVALTTMTAGKRWMRAHVVDEPVSDYWLVDADTPSPWALEMHYDDGGRWLGAELVNDRSRLDDYRRIRDLVWNLATPLNTYL